MSDTLTLAIVLIPSLVIAIVFHEVAHGMVAYWLGDPTASERNRLSLNPLRHVDPVGTLLVPGMLALASGPIFGRSEEHTSELQSLMRISYAVFCLKTKKINTITYIKTPIT